MSDVISIPGQIELGFNFTRGCFSTTEIGSEKRICRAVKTFGDVAHYADSGTPNLITKSEVTSEFPLITKVVNQVTQVLGRIPGREIFKTCEGSHTSNYARPCPIYEMRNTEFGIRNLPNR